MNDGAGIIKKEGLVAILRGVSLEQALPLARALFEGGVRVVEVAFDQRDPGTIEKTGAIISRIHSAYAGGLLLGAGTVLTPKQAEAARQAGASFIFSPNVNSAVIRKTGELGMASIPGAFTPSEIMAAMESGADIVKLFPVTVRDIGYVANVARPLSHVPFLCVGGVTEPEDIRPFFRAGAVGVGTGLSIVGPGLLARGDYRGIAQRARLHVEKVREAQHEAGIDLL